MIPADFPPPQPRLRPALHLPLPLLLFPLLLLQLQPLHDSIEVCQSQISL